MNVAYVRISPRGAVLSRRGSALASVPSRARPPQAVHKKGPAHVMGHSSGSRGNRCGTIILGGNNPASTRNLVVPEYGRSIGTALVRARQRFAHLRRRAIVAGLEEVHHRAGPVARRFAATDTRNNAGEFPRSPASESGAQDRAPASRCGRMRAVQHRLKSVHTMHDHCVREASRMRCSRSSHGSSALDRGRPS